MIQEQFLNYLLNSGDISIISTNRIDDTFFTSYKSEFNFINKHIETYGTVPDKYTFLNKFETFETMDVGETPNYLVSALFKEKKRYVLTEAVKSVVTDIKEDNADKAVTRLENLLEGLSASTTNLTYVDIAHDVKNRYDDFLDKSMNFSKYFLTTGFKELDDILGGGWNRKEELAAFVARPGVGKSWSLIKSAEAAAEKGLAVGYYSGEMTTMKMGYRFDTTYGHMSNRDIMHGNSFVQNEYKQYLDKLDEEFTGKFYVITPGDLGRMATVSDLRAFIERANLDVLFIDQYSLMEDEQGGKNEREQTSNIAKGLKNLQMQKQIPIICASQQNRGGDSDSVDNVLDVSRISTSDRIGQNSSTVVFLEVKDDILTLTLAKTRDSNGTGKKLKYSIDYNTGKYVFLPTEGENPTMQTQELIDTFGDGTEMFSMGEM